MTIKLNQPFVRLPVQFDGDALVAEVKALPQSAWVPHPDGFPGNNAVRLISPKGEETDASAGQMMPTANLEACPYIQEIMGWIGSVWGRSRLMGLAAGAQVPPHIDSHYYWRTHIRIHVPIITNPGVLFSCGEETVHMAPGECWVFDSFLPHNVQNTGDAHRTHLVVDTVGGGRLYDLIEAGRQRPDMAPVRIGPGDGGNQPLRLEQYNSPDVMSPWEVRNHLAFLWEEVQPHPALAQVRAKLDRFVHEWGAVWAAHGPAPEAVPTYRQLLQLLWHDLSRVDGMGIVLKNGVQLYQMVHRLIVQQAVAIPDPREQRLAS